MRGSRYRLKTRLTMLTVAVCVLALAAQGVALIAVQASRARENTTREIALALDGANSTMVNQMGYLGGAIRSLRHNSAVVSYLSGAIVSQEELIEQLNYCTDLYSDQNLAAGVPFVERAYLFGAGDALASVRYYPVTQSAAEEDDEAMLNELRAFRESGRETRLYVREGELSLMTRLYDDKLSMMGCAAFILTLDAVSSIYESLSQYDGARFCLWLAESGALFGNLDAAMSADAAIALARGKGGALELAGKSYLASARRLPFKLYAVAAVPREQVDWLVRSATRSFIWLVLLILPFVAIACFLLVYSITRPLKTVARKIMQVAAGDFSTRLEPFSSQEFYEIGVTFNQMTEKIHHLITEVYENQLLAKEAELKFLQSQIDPHFMFNVLSMIAMTVKQSGDEEAYKMIHSFAKFVQGNIFSDDKLCVPLREEMRLVDYYLYLQCKRYEGSVSYSIICEDERLLEIQVPKLCIEPIVENAFLHGVAPKPGGGRIEVNIERRGDILAVRVDDDGVGFTTLNKEPEGHTHMGITNTRRLIQNLFGEGYGVEIISKPGEGARVTITLPIEGVVK